MFVKLNKEEINGCTSEGIGRDEPAGDVYINIEEISHIDGNFVAVNNYVFHCSYGGIKKIVGAIKQKIGVIDCNA